MNSDLQLLARNAKIQLDAGIETLHHFRPRRGEEGNEAAIIRLSAIIGSYYAAKVFDEREDSVLISRGLAGIRTAEKAAKDYMDHQKVDEAIREAKKAWPEYLELNASISLAYETTKKRRHPVLVLRDPEEVEPDGLLTAIVFDKDIFSSFGTREAYGSWARTVLDYDSKENVNHFLLLTVTSNESPIVVFYREIKEGRLVATDYLLANERRIIRRTAQIETEEWLEGEPLPDTVVSFEEEIPEEPIESSEPTTQAEHTVGANGKVQVECLVCEQTVRVGVKKLEKGQARCPKCKNLIGEE